MRTLLLVIATLANIGSAFGETYPSRPITIIVPFAAGGGTDVTARILAERMRPSLGQPLVVENVIGAGGSTGVGRAVNAAPDGYTIVIGHWGTHVANGAIYALRYNLMKDFEPISLVASTRWFIIAKKNLPAHDLKGLVAWSKTKPDKVLAGTGGQGSPEHVTGVFFQNMTGARLQFVPYRGAGPALQDLLAGHIEMMIIASTIALPYVQAGSVKTFAIMDKSRLAQAPDVPTVDEAGVPELYFASWHGLWAPKGTPRSVIEKLNAAVVEALADPTVGKRLGDLGQTIFPRAQLTPGALGAHQKAEIEKWWPIIKAAGVKPE
jgi:tripartite-type tricarboxylate transporter receptor subunit TctC